MKRMSILVVDDNRDFAESLGDVLELDGHKVTLAFSGEEAFSLFKEQEFDLTFMDIKLPGKNGVESFSEIRKIRPSARVIMMTGYSVPQLLEQAVENGAWEIMHKPLELPRVLAMLEKIKPCGILIADDDPDFFTGLREVLEKDGYTVFVANNGEEALRQMGIHRVDVMILDLRMPVMNGLETFTKLRESGSCVPTIIVTAYPREESDTVSLLERLSVYGVLSKPFDTGELLTAIDTICASLEKEAGEDRP